ncbi:MAG: ABC transporter ATP-binding protein [Burkholderiaceae bacterium]|jgi:peptide/nickel transport system ATP-binding protein
MTLARPTLSVEDLHTYFVTPAATAKAVQGVSFDVAPGQIMGLVGESGSGKSMTGFSIMNLVDPPGRIVAGRIRLHGQDMRSLGEAEWRRLRGNRIAMVFQDPMMTLNPVLSIGTQMIEAVRAHSAISRQAARDLAHEALERVGIAAAGERLNAYPHQLSGGMRQRVVIAIAQINRPDLIICDEPTTALDVTIQGQILSRMQELCRESSTALVWITHDLSLVAGLADTVSVMYAGRIIESGTTAEVLESPCHPYTYGLLSSTPAAALRQGGAHGSLLTPIPGVAPSLWALPTGCAFRPRCPRASTQCETDPPVTRGRSGRTLRCFHPLGPQDWSAIP